MQKLECIEQNKPILTYGPEEWILNRLDSFERKIFGATKIDNFGGKDIRVIESYKTCLEMCTW